MTRPIAARHHTHKMASLSDLAAVRCALTIVQAGHGPKGSTLADFKRAMVLGEPLSNMDMFAVLEDAVRRGCTDVDLLRTLAMQKLDAVVPGIAEEERQSVADRVAEKAAQNGWDAALSVFSDVWFDHNVHKIVLVEYDWSGVHALEIDGVRYGTTSGGDAKPTNLSLFPADVAKRLLSTSACASDLPHEARHLDNGRLERYLQERYYLKGYSLLHVSSGGTNFTPLKLPEYAVAKAASGLTDEQFDTLWDVYLAYRFFTDKPFHEAEGQFLIRDYVGYLHELEERFDEDVIAAWVTKIRPMCTVLPAP